MWRVSSDQPLGITRGALERVGDFSRIAWVEVDEGPFDRVDNGRAEVKTRADGPDLWLDVEAREPAWIVVSETHWKGWRAIDGEGREIPLHFANLAFLGLRVPAGEHRIHLVYRPRSFDAGLAIAGLAVLGVGGAVWIRRRWQPALEADAQMEVEGAEAHQPLGRQLAAQMALGCQPPGRNCGNSSAGG